jgi:hypothetical protein
VDITIFCNFNAVKKFLAISFLSLYLISLTELSQLVKLPSLVEHYIEHKEKQSDLSLWEFLSMHYTQNANHDTNHEKLPFKSHNGCINMVVIAFISNNFESISVNAVYTENKTTIAYSEKFSTSSFLSSIWQPPKSC